MVRMAPAMNGLYTESMPSGHSRNICHSAQNKDGHGIADGYRHLVLLHPCMFPRAVESAPGMSQENLCGDLLLP